MLVRVCDVSAQHEAVGRFHVAWYVILLSGGPQSIGCGIELDVFNVAICDRRIQVQKMYTVPYSRFQFSYLRSNTALILCELHSMMVLI